MDGYNNQPVSTAFDAVTLTATAAGNQHTIECGGMKTISFDVDYGGSNTMKLTLEHSPDGGTNWYSLVIDDTSTTSVITPRVWDMAATGKYNFIVNVAYKMLRVSVYESGGTGSTASVSYTQSGI